MSWPDLFIYGLVISLGAAVGSFLNVVIYRLPAGLSLLRPPSRCPQCQTQLKPYDNVPVLGWLWLQGKCRYCQNAISSRYPVVEVATASMFLGIFLLFGYQLRTLGYWLFASVLISLALIDFDLMVLPNPLTKLGVISGLAFQSVLGWHLAGLAGLIQGLIFSFLSAIAGIWLIELISISATIIFKKQAMGGGDGKLMAMIGAWLGWKYMLLSLFLGCFAGSIVGLGGQLIGKISRFQKIPFGPFLVIGALVSMMAGQQIWVAYQQGIVIFYDWLGIGLN
ncbi:MAG: prepilin peptidase [Acaryochloris sp. RU_4_1]|nr:prepilin peptidase [Acaryochloris sp. SU_5_25]NJM66030.1 prepilin peptidase [Acaryochloris sp. RU_4_1]NJN37620.1 prepilin peptidase [Acaryochloridaceae cyanobacterium CSU_3_4]NJR53767.1 prepilin peptidase [Acaryochloris sp. CRU_2_0]